MIDETSIFYLYDKVILEWLQSMDFRKAVYGANPTDSQVVEIRYQAMNTVYPEDTPESMHSNRRNLVPRISLTRLDEEFDEDRYQYGTFRSGSTQPQKSQQNREVNR